VSKSLLDVTDATFGDEVLKSDVPVLLDVWAPWCGPCRMVSPIIEELAQDNAGKVKVCKLNVDDNPETAGKFGISAIPTVLLFKDGKEVQKLRTVGVQSKSAYQKAIDQAVSG
jgi:thioredoxin 1